MSKDILAPLFIAEGACATGGTTLVEQLSASKPDKHVISPEAARTFFQEHPNIPIQERHLLSTQRKIQDAFIQNIYIALEKARRLNSVVISDGSPLAPAAYAMLSDEKMAMELFENVRGWFHCVTCFLILDHTDVKYSLDPRDPVRKETPQQRLHVQRNLIRLINLTKRPYDVLSGTVEERVKRFEALKKEFSSTARQPE